MLSAIVTEVTPLAERAEIGRITVLRHVIEVRNGENDHHGLNGILATDGCPSAARDPDLEFRPVFLCPTAMTVDTLAIRSTTATTVIGSALT